MSLVERADAEEVHNHWVDGRCFPCATGNGGRFIYSRAGRGHVCFRTHVQEGSLVGGGDEGGELKVGFG